MRECEGGVCCVEGMGRGERCQLRSWCQCVRVCARARVCVCTRAHARTASHLNPVMVVSLCVVVLVGEVPASCGASVRVCSSSSSASMCRVLVSATCACTACAHATVCAMLPSHKCRCYNYRMCDCERYMNHDAAQYCNIVSHLQVHRQQRRVPVVGDEGQVVIAIHGAATGHVPHLGGGEEEGVSVSVTLGPSGPRALWA